MSGGTEPVSMRTAVLEVGDSLPILSLLQDDWCMQQYQKKRKSCSLLAEPGGL